MFTGPNIVRDGLVLALDAANEDSFRGEPTVNVINGGANRANVVTSPISVGTHAGITRTTSLTSYSSDRPNVLRYTSTNNTGYSMLNQQFSIQNQSGTTYTYSFEYKQLAGASNALVFSVVYPNGYKTPSGETAASNISNTQIDLEDGWKRWILTYTCNNTGYNYIRFNLFTGGHLGTGDGDFDFYFDNFMLQEGSERTRFVAGTRGTTVATGGGWADISGNSNHGEILNGTSTSNDDTVLGALDFDGTNDYINIAESITLGSEWSVEAWIYLINGNDYTHIFSSQTAQTEFTCKIAETSDDRKPYFYKNGVVNTFSGTSKGLDLNTWHHLVYTYDGSTVRIYIDTEEVRSVSATMNIGSDTYSIGDSGNTNEFGTFRLSKHMVRTKNLTASEVLQNYNATKGRFGL